MNTRLTKYKDSEDKIKRQTAYYEQQQFPKNFGLWETGVIIRKNNDKIKTMEQKWWELLNTYSHRDQLSFPFILWKYQSQLNIKMYTMGWNMMNCVTKTPYDHTRPFIIYPHSATNIC